MRTVNHVLDPVTGFWIGLSSVDNAAQTARICLLNFFLKKTDAHAYC